MATTASRQPSEPEAAVTLRGTQRGLEVEIPPGTDAGTIVTALREKLEESPQFFAGNDVILKFLGEVVTGSLGPLEALCREFDLAIVGIHSPREDRRKVARAALAVVDELAEKSAPVIKPPPLVPAREAKSSPVPKNASTPTLHPPPAGGGFSRELTPPRPAPPPAPAPAPAQTLTPAQTPAQTPAPAPAPAPAQTLTPAPAPAQTLTPAQTPAPAPALAPTLPPPAPRPTLTPPPRARFVRGPIRSGSVLESHEHLVILGDVNPGAEVRSLGSITVLGRLRGVAHAGAGHPDGTGGFILALELAPQQLRLGDLVARAGDADSPAGRTEIAYAKDQQIIVETYRGALPRPLWGLVS